MIFRPYFKKSENFNAPDIEHQKTNSSLFHPDFHGTGGPLSSSYSVTYGASHQYWHKTLHKLGIETNASHFSGSNVGVWTSLTGVTPEKRERSYSAIAYYKPNSSRKNLHLLSDATVQEIILESQGGSLVATGVLVNHENQEHVVKTSGEIVVCGGSVSSPQVLELSGIGDPNILARAGIDCDVPNPNVGNNLQEHMMTAMIYEVSPSIVTPEDLRADPLLAEAADNEYALHATGPRTAIPSSVSYLPFTHFVSTQDLERMVSPLVAPDAPAKSPHAEHDSIILSRFTSPKNIGQIEYNFDISNYNPYFKSEPGKKYATMLMMLQYPFSRGSIHIPPTTETLGRKAVVEDKPVIDPQYYAGEGGAIDFELMVRSQHFAHKICQTSPLKDIIIRRAFPVDPAEHAVHNGAGHTNGVNGSNGTTKGTANGTATNGTKSRPEGAEKEDLSSWVRDTTITDWHPVGTCSMGPSIAQGAVVDDRLRVHGVHGLRVCDASIMPLQISAHLQATVYAIGEKGADLIKEDWRARGPVSGMRGS